jgi:hypothetical protein
MAISGAVERRHANRALPCTVLYNNGLAQCFAQWHKKCVPRCPYCHLVIG